MLLFFPHSKQALLYFSCIKIKNIMPILFIPYGIERGNKYLHFQVIVLSIQYRDNTATHTAYE